MRKAIGFVIVLYAVTQFMEAGWSSFERAVAATFDTIEIAAVISKDQLIDMSK